MLTTKNKPTDPLQQAYLSRVEQANEQAQTTTKIARQALIEQAKELRAALNKFANDPDVKFLRRAIEAEGIRGIMLDYGELIFNKTPSRGHLSAESVQLLLTPSGFRIAHGTPVPPDTGWGRVVDIRWKWCSLVAELIKGGSTLQGYKDSIRREIEARLPRIDPPTLDQIVNPEGGPRDSNIIPPIKLKDGTLICMFASGNHYCEPKSNAGPYTSIELTISKHVKPENLRGYTSPTRESVRTYCYVPLTELAKFIDKHGGIEKVYVLNEKTHNWE